MASGKYLIGLLALARLSVPATAQESGSEVFRFSGFGTLGAVRSSETKADFASTALQPDGAGFSRQTSFTNDKKVGLQVNAQFTEWLSVAAQGVSDYRYDKTYNPAMTLAFMKVQVAPEVSIRAGRIPFPAYIISDYQKTGYAYTWVRPPIEVYQFNPIVSMDGGDVTWQTNAGSTSLVAKAFGGSSDPTASANRETTDITFRKLVGLSISAKQGASTYRATYTWAKASIDSPSITDALSQIRNGVPPLHLPADPTLANQLTMDHSPVTYASMGYQYDPGDWFILGEVARNAGSNSNSPVVHATAGYVTGGLRLGDWTPYLMVAQRSNSSSTASLNPIANALLANGNRASHSFSAGLRWDFMRNFDLKVQFDQTKNSADSIGALTNPQPGFQSGKSYNLVTVNLDFVF